MASLERRLARLEDRQGDKWDREDEEFVSRLTDGELGWLLEPAEEAQRLVPCPHVELVTCGCRGDEREQRGFEAHPELFEEYLRRREILLERNELGGEE
jgi:hypothetical protein